ncbi:MAG: lysophospholipid acyltransferase family protein, partial [Cyclobacteriaceae bacterium]|nr:lysophospholipid acyltransferase family protein [Cyclobacteriaceae bacterium]
LSVIFPDKKDEEIKKIRKKFFRSLSDYVAEIFKAVTMSEKLIHSSIKFSNPEVLSEKYAGKTVIVLTGHVFNWEWYGMAISHTFKTKGGSAFIYQKISNGMIDQMMLQARGRFGAKPFLREQTARAVIGAKDNATLFYILADQTPFGKVKRFWTYFMGRPTAFYLGIDQVVKMTKLPVVYCSIKRIGRGKFEVTFKEIENNDSDFQVLKEYISLLEEDIKRNPSEWLWTHRRWKLKMREQDVYDSNINFEK